MHRLLVFALAVPLSACALIPKEEITTGPPTQETQNVPQVTLADLYPSPTPVECVNVVQLPPLAEQEAPTKKATRGETKATPVSFKAEKQPSATQIVTTAQKDALVQPDTHTYFGKSLNARYVYQAGKNYEIRLGPDVTTSITFPPKETLSIGLALKQAEFLHAEKVVGTDEAKHVVAIIAPQANEQGEYPKGTYDVSLLTDVGHEYRLRLIVGKSEEAMRAVIFEMPTMHEEK